MTSLQTKPFYIRQERAKFHSFLSPCFDNYSILFSCRACDRLHCTSCDNKVVTFDDFKWDDSLGYLFFRNNYPDFDRLKPSLKPRRGKYFSGDTAFAPVSARRPNRKRRNSKNASVARKLLAKFLNLHSLRHLKIYLNT